MKPRLARSSGRHARSPAVLAAFAATAWTMMTRNHHRTSVMSATSCARSSGPIFQMRIPRARMPSGRRAVSNRRAIFDATRDKLPDARPGVTKKSKEIGVRDAEGAVKALEASVKPVEVAAKPLERSVKPVEPSVTPLEPSLKPLEGSVTPLEPSVKPLEPSVKAIKPSMKAEKRHIRAPEASLKALESSVK